MISTQSALCKLNFNVVVNRFLTISIEESIESNDILIKCFVIGEQTSGKKATFKDGQENEVEAPNCTVFL